MEWCINVNERRKSNWNSTSTEGDIQTTTKRKKRVEKANISISLMPAVSVEFWGIYSAKSFLSLKTKV
jgi:hypothetical protein